MTENYTIRPAAKVYGRGGGRPKEEMRGILDKWRDGSVDGAPHRTVKIRSGGVSIQRDVSAFVQTGEVTLHDWSGFDVTVVVEVAGKPQPHVFVDEIRVRRRPAGTAIAARTIQAAHLGEAIRAAVSELTMAERPEQHVVSALRPGASRRYALDEEIQRVAELYRDATVAGVPTRAFVQSGLADLRSCRVEDVRDAGNRIRQARNRGLIPPAGGTTRPTVKEG